MRDEEKKFYKLETREVGGMISASSKKNTVNDSRMEMDRLTWNKIRRVLKHLAGVYNFIILTLLNCNVQVLYKIIFRK